MLRSLFLALMLSFGVLPATASAQTLQDVLQAHAEEVAKPSRRSVGVLLDDLAASGLPQAVDFLEAWRDREIVQREADGLFFRDLDDTLYDVDTGDAVGPAEDVKAVRPNGGVRRAIGEVLVQFQLSSPDIERRQSAIDAIARSPAADQLAPLQGSIDGEPDAALRARKIELVNMLAARFGETTEIRVAAIEALSDSMSVETRAVLNQILTSTPQVAETIPDNTNVAAVLSTGADGLTVDDAYAQLVEADLAPAVISADAIREALIANISEGSVGGVSVTDLDNDAARETAYSALAEAGTVVPLVLQTDREAAVAAHQFFTVYQEPDNAVTEAARTALDAIESRVGLNQFFDLSLDALSLASIYFLAAIGLAITFGVMGVINMAHG
ncbi:MAG: urea ABC transporter permease subunit UrtB, partial [Pseudomonadota bacterium]